MNDRLLPWVRVGFAVMVVTGVLLFYAIPGPHLSKRVVPRQGDLPDPGDDQHLVLPLRASSPSRGAWDTAARLPWVARRAGLASLILWALIIVFGRFIAYNWFDCDIQPQSAFVNWFAGCVVPPAQ